MVYELRQLGAMSNESSANDLRLCTEYACVIHFRVWPLSSLCPSKPDLDTFSINGNSLTVRAREGKALSLLSVFPNIVASNRLNTFVQQFILVLQFPIQRMI